MKHCKECDFFKKTDAKQPIGNCLLNPPVVHFVTVPVTDQKDERGNPVPAGKRSRLALPDTQPQGDMQFTIQQVSVTPIVHEQSGCSAWRPAIMPEAGNA
jgi:hypothetical protein